MGLSRQMNQEFPSQEFKGLASVLALLYSKLRDDVIISATSYWLEGSNKFRCCHHLNVGGVVGARWTANVESSHSKVAHQLMSKVAAGRQWAKWIWHACRNQGLECSPLSSGGSNCSPVELLMSAVQAGY